MYYSFEYKGVLTSDLWGKVEKSGGKKDFSCEENDRKNPWCPVF